MAACSCTPPGAQHSPCHKRRQGPYAVTRCVAPEGQEGSGKRQHWASSVEVGVGLPETRAAIARMPTLSWPKVTSPGVRRSRLESDSEQQCEGRGENSRDAATLLLAGEASVGEHCSTPVVHWDNTAVLQAARTGLPVLSCGKGSASRIALTASTACNPQLLPLHADHEPAAVARSFSIWSAGASYFPGVS